MLLDASQQVKRDRREGRSGISERDADGQRPAVRRKSYQFETERLPRDKLTARAFWAILRLTYGKPLWNPAAVSLGCSPDAIRGWSYGLTSIPRAAAELALVRARKRRAGLREAHEAAMAREDAELAAAIADMERHLNLSRVR